MNVVDLIKLHEGCRLLPYDCTAGKLTIGYGRNLEDVGITQSEAELLLAGDISRITIELDKRLPWMKELCYVRRAALIDMGFNLGAPRLLKFVKTLKHIESGEYEAAAKEMLDSKWARQVGKRAGRLSEMMRTGHWPEGVI